MQAIISTTSNWCLGTAEGVPWFDQEETHRFQSLTLGGTCVMGRKTYDLQLPWMKKCRKVVLSRQPMDLPDALVHGTITGIAKTYPDAWVVGGAMTFQAFMPYMRFIYLTKFPQTVQGAVWMPDIAWSLWTTGGKTLSCGRDMIVLERRPLARSQYRADSAATAARKREEAKSS